MKSDQERFTPYINKEVIIDKGYNNSGPVILVKIYGLHFCRVKDPNDGYEWETMLYRLSEPDKPKT